MPKLALFHTSETHIARFDALLGELEPGLSVTHEVRAQLLEDARNQGGVSESLRQALGRSLTDLAQRADVILCTCSTLGAAAEAFDRHREGNCGARVVRIDRPLARAAVAQASRLRGHRIAVVAALASTLEPTRHLLEEEAAKASLPVTLTFCLTEAAWACFERGDTDGYLRAVASAAYGAAETADVVVLAQASMAGAERLVQTRKPVLSSPKLGLEAALVLVS